MARNKGYRDVALHREWIPTYTAFKKFFKDNTSDNSTKVIFEFIIDSYVKTIANRYGAELNDPVSLEEARSFFPRMSYNTLEKHLKGFKGSAHNLIGVEDLMELLSKRYVENNANGLYLKQEVYSCLLRVMLVDHGLTGRQLGKLLKKSSAYVSSLLRLYSVGVVK